MATVTSMTTAFPLGAFTIKRKDDQSNVPIDTIIIIPTRTGIGICTTKYPRTITKNIRNAPATKVDSLHLPPDLTLMTDLPYMEQPATPPKRPVILLAIHYHP